MSLMGDNKNIGYNIPNGKSVKTSHRDIMFNNVCRDLFDDVNITLLI